MNRLPYEAGWKRKKASQVSWTWVIREKKMGELVDFVLMLPILGTRFCYMIWLVRSMTVDKWVMIIEWISSSFHEKYLHAHECYWSQSIEPQKKKHYNLTGLICTLLTCYRPMCYRIDASGWIHGIKTKPSGFCTFFSPPGHAWLQSFAIFFVIFFAPLHLGACLQTTLIPSIPYCSLLALLVIGIDLTYWCLCDIQADFTVCLCWCWWRPCVNLHYKDY